jgi:hypothetical protein
VAGESGSFTKLTRDVFLIAFELMRENHWTTLLAPLAVLIPAITYLNYLDEQTFCRRWASRILEPPKARKHPRWITGPQAAAEEGV